MQANLMLVPTIIGFGIMFWIGSSLEKHLRPGPLRIGIWGLSALLAFPGLLFAIYYFHLFDSAAWFYNLRTIRFTELLGCGLGFAAGVFQSWWQPETFGERVAAPGALAVLLLVPFVKPLLDPLDLDQFEDRCPDNVCMQSTFSTCGPASAATLLRTFGNEATEKELARESRTSRGGTEIWYLSRALRSRRFQTTVVIQPRMGSRRPHPVIAGVLLPGHSGHFVAVLDSNEVETTIADPLKGKVVLGKGDLAHRYDFTGFFLVIGKQTRQ